jgi:GDP-4-dehydro-6-deoxy-D-mannose reductase
VTRRVLITGAAGFAGAHLAAACVAAGDEVVAVSRSSGVRADLRDPAAARAVVRDARPEVVYHLAALAHVGRSWREPAATLRDNQAMSVAVLEAVRAEAPDAVVVAVSSGEVYGPPATLPVDEQALLRPQNPYAVSKAASDLLAGFYADAHGLRVVRPRAFNHAGPGQPPLFALASFARQVAAGLEAGDDPVRVVTGNPEARRDFTDVRDVVQAYRRLAEAEAPGVFNVCSGSAVSRASCWTRSARSPAWRSTMSSTGVSCAPTRSWRCAGRSPASTKRRAGRRRSRCAGRSPTRWRGGGRRSARGGLTRARTNDPPNLSLRRPRRGRTRV